MNKFIEELYTPLNLGKILQEFQQRVIMPKQDAEMFFFKRFEQFKKNQDLPRSQKLSAQQWGISRVYAFINKFEKGYIPNHDVDLLREYFLRE